MIVAGRKSETRSPLALFCGRTSSLAGPGRTTKMTEQDRTASSFQSSGEVNSASLRRSRLPVQSLLLLACGLAAFSIDCPWAQWCLSHKWPGFASELLQIGECFGNAIGAALVILAAFHLLPTQRRRILRVVAITFGAGITADLVKLLVVRTRPHHFDLSRWFERWETSSARVS